MHVRGLEARGRDPAPACRRPGVAVAACRRGQARDGFEPAVGERCIGSKVAGFDRERDGFLRRRPEAKRVSPLGSRVAPKEPLPPARERHATIVMAAHGPGRCGPASPRAVLGDRVQDAGHGAVAANVDTRCGGDRQRRDDRLRRPVRRCRAGRADAQRRGRQPKRAGPRSVGFSSSVRIVTLPSPSAAARRSINVRCCGSFHAAGEIPSPAHRTRRCPHAGQRFARCHAGKRASAARDAPARSAISRAT